MQKIIYLCPVDWRWIKQRPQFLAEELSEFYEIHAIYPFQNNRKYLQKKADTHVRLTPCFSIPTLGGKLRFFAAINKWLNKFQVGLTIAAVRPDYVWVSMPWQMNWLPKNIKCPVIYDCMDDYAAINMDPAQQETVIRQEREILDKAGAVFVSSENLRGILKARHGLSDEQMTLLRNGYNANWEAEPIQPTPRQGRLKIGYFGTVGRWFDFPLLLESLKENPQVEYHLYGPMERGSQVPPHERIVYHGVIEHDQIRREAKKLDALMMPFVVNDIVASVDPIKLYEYIYLNKNIVCVRYPEIARFEPFVMFYHTREEFMEQLRQLQQNSQVKFTASQAEEFLRENSWHQRARQACAVIRAKMDTEDQK